MGLRYGLDPDFILDNKTIRQMQAMGKVSDAQRRAQLQDLIRVAHADPNEFMEMLKDRSAQGAEDPWLELAQVMGRADLIEKHEDRKLLERILRGQDGRRFHS